MFIITASDHNLLRQENEAVVRIKDELKTDPISIEIINEFGFEKDIIDGISISFSSKLMVPAKTVDSKISLNMNLLDSSFDKMMRYAVHELTHALQHMTKKKANNNSENYLDDNDEIEAFQNQVKYEAKNNGKGSAEKYVRNLLNYHDIPMSEKNTKSKDLLSKVD